MEWCAPAFSGKPWFGQCLSWWNISMTGTPITESIAALIHQCIGGALHSDSRPILKPVVWHVPRGAPAPFSLRMLDNDNTTNLQLPHHTSYNELQSSYNELQSSRSVFLTCCNSMSQYGIRGRYEHPSVALGSLPSQPICRDIRKRGSWRSLLPDCHPGTTPRVSSCTPSKTGSSLCVQPFVQKSLHAALLVANYS